MNTYPETLYANVLLYQGKIINWNIGANELSLGTITSPYPIYTDHETVTVETQSFIAHDDREYHEILETTAPKWIRNWEFHDMFTGVIPY